MTSFMALDGVTSFLRLKHDTNTCKRMRRDLCIGGSSSVRGVPEDKFKVRMGWVWEPLPFVRKKNQDMN